MSVCYFHDIKGVPVFLSLEKGAELTRLALANKDVMWRFSMAARNGPERREAQKLEKQYLLAEYRREPERFKSRWSVFDLRGVAAQDNLFRALSAYAAFNRKQLGFRDNRHVCDPLGDWMREIEHDARWPYGRMYEVVFYCRHHRLEVLISTDAVESISGTLSDLRIESRHYVLVCSAERVTLKPPDELISLPNHGPKADAQTRS